MPGKEKGIDSVAQHFFHILYGSCFTYHRQAVSQLQGQLCSGKKLYAATIYTTDVDAVMVAQMKRAKLLSVQFGARHYDPL